MVQKGSPSEGVNSDEPAPCPPQLGPQDVRLPRRPRWNSNKRRATASGSSFQRGAVPHHAQGTQAQEASPSEVGELVAAAGCSSPEPRTQLQKMFRYCSDETAQTRRIPLDQAGFRGTATGIRTRVSGLRIRRKPYRWGHLRPCEVL